MVAVLTLAHPRSLLRQSRRPHACASRRPSSTRSSIRIAIGAGRGRILRQLLTESLLLASLGSIAGLALGYAAMRVLLSAPNTPRWLSAVPDWRVLLFTIVATVLAATFFGLAPALQIARQRQQKTIVRQMLVAAQVAASCILLIVAALLVRATQHVMYTDPGFGYRAAPLHRSATGQAWLLA